MFQAKRREMQKDPRKQYVTDFIIDDKSVLGLVSCNECFVVSKLGSEIYNFQDSTAQTDKKSVRIGIV